MTLFPQGFHRSLAKIQNLRKFCLSSDKVTSDGLSVLASLTALTHLDFTRCTGIRDGVYDLALIHAQQLAMVGFPVFRRALLLEVIFREWRRWFLCIQVFVCVRSFLPPSVAIRIQLISHYAQTALTWCARCHCWRQCAWTTVM